MAFDWFEDTDYAIGLTANTLMSLRDLNIPPPDQPVFTPAALYRVRGDLSRVGDGFPMANWIWDVISVATLYPVINLLGGADFKELYIRTDKRDASTPSPDLAFNVYSCIMWKPILAGDEGVYVARSPYALQTVQIQFKRLILSV